MGQLIDGQWRDEDRRGVDATGAFVRTESLWRQWVRADGSTPFVPEAGRYHLFVNAGCPWAWRTVLYRALRGLEDAISISFTAPGMGPQGWTFAGADGVASEPLLGVTHLHEVYTRAAPGCTSRVTVPVLWDKRTGTVVNNESSEIIRMLDEAFDGVARFPGGFRPAHLREQIDALNATIYADVNNGVYRCGFARSQGAYDQAFDALFATLDALDARLAGSRFLLGDTITEADWRLLPTLLRFDLAYYGLFRCNARRLVDYPNLWPYARELYQQPRVAAVVDWDACKRIYWSGQRIIPRGPFDDWAAPHGRG